MRTVIHAEGITKSFGFQKVLRGLDFTAEEQETVALMGPNGAGKTTLLYVLATLLAPESGSIAYFGQPLKNNEIEIRRRLGIVGHQLMLYADLTVEENLNFYTKMYTLSNREQRMTAVLDLVDLNKHRRQLVRTLSRGMQQRLTIARAMLHDPLLLFLDEPFAGLDQGMTEKMLQLVQKITSQNKTVVFVTHNFREVSLLATRVLFLKAGNFVGNYEVTGMDEHDLSERYQTVMQPTI